MHTYILGHHESIISVFCPDSTTNWISIKSALQQNAVQDPDDLNSPLLPRVQSEVSPAI